ncbi:hypothetical protein [Bacillus cihuensis]|uniref:hypothetical protein n=1 Tax=Bacillus cihuensis TaxID=1208599 RepID=UPI00041C1645|nr:hypothetical protein [Bacillus cihuensis]
MVQKMYMLTEEEFLKMQEDIDNMERVLRIIDKAIIHAEESNTLRGHNAKLFLSIEDIKVAYTTLLQEKNRMGKGANVTLYLDEKAPKSQDDWYEFRVDSHKRGDGY